jgi:hypothetical protein
MGKTQSFRQKLEYGQKNNFTQGKKRLLKKKKNVSLGHSRIFLGEIV